MKKNKQEKNKVLYKENIVILKYKAFTDFFKKKLIQDTHILNICDIKIEKYCNIAKLK